MKTASVILRGALLLLAFAGISTWAWKNFGPVGNPSTATDSSAEGDVDPGPVAPAHQVLVTYFTTDQRCPTCLKIEKQAKAAVESAFARQLASGEVRFETKNFDRDDNKDLIRRYDLSFKTVVISNRRNGREVDWAKFDKVWDLVGDPEAFAAYLQEGIRKHLKSETDA